MPRQTRATAPTSTRAEWRLCLLGRPALVATVDAGRSLALRPKDAALLALVALGGPVQSQRIVRLRRDSGATLVDTGATMALAAGVDVDLAATLAAIGSDENAGRAELLGDLDFDDLPDFAEW